MLRSIKGITSLAKAWKGATYTFGQMLRETGIALERGGMYFQGDFAYRDERKSFQFGFVVRFVS